MRRAHREAARELYHRDHNKNSSIKTSSPDDEIYVDLHGLHADEAVAHLEKALAENDSEPRPIYVITGFALHTKSGRDKIGRAIRSFLNEWRYAFREFAAPGDRSSGGGGGGGGGGGSIIAIDARSWDRRLPRGGFGSDSNGGASRRVAVAAATSGDGGGGGGGGAVDNIPAEGGGALLALGSPSSMANVQNKDGGSDGGGDASGGVEIDTDMGDARPAVQTQLMC